jgi:hypothetical protein
MSVRVVARIRPLLEKELDRDIIVHADSSADAKHYNVVKIPNPKNESEEFSFTFNSVYERETTQEDLFSAEGKLHVQPLVALRIMFTSFRQSNTHGSFSPYQVPLPRT